jgi:hypothetical protein
MGDELLTLNLGNVLNYQINVNPTVALQILEFYYRRNKSFDKVIGTLLGRVYPN